MCIASVKSMTYALKAKRALASFYINSEVVKLDTSMTKNGCAYGVKFDCINLYAAENALKSHNISYSQILTNSQ
jgi:hypothetical protein